MIEPRQDVFDPEGKIGNCYLAARPLILGTPKQLDLGLSAREGDDLAITASPVNPNDRG
jgi:hypothetical protein